MTNPKAVLAWIAIMSLGLRHDAPLWVVGAIVIGTSALSLAIHYLYAVAFSTPTMVRLYGRARRAIRRVLRLRWRQAPGEPVAAPPPSARPARAAVGCLDPPARVNGVM
jgi:hypothetical protein